MELLQLKYFCDAAKTQNFSQTARKFSVPTSNISNAIKRLEVEFECQFFDHFSNKIALNEQGRIFYKKVSSALLLLEDAQTMVKEYSNVPCGEIRLRCKSNRGIVTQAMEDFNKVYPNVKFRMNFGEAPMSDIDIMISYNIPMVEAEEKVFILEEELPIAMHKSNPLASKEDLEVIDLKNERFIVGLSVQTNSECRNAGFIPNIAFELNDPAYVRKYIEMGLGVAFIPAISWRGKFSDDVVLKSVGVKRKTFAYLPKNKYTKKSVEKFLEFLLAAAKNAVDEYEADKAQI